MDGSDIRLTLDVAAFLAILKQLPTGSMETDAVLADQGIQNLVFYTGPWASGVSRKVIVTVA